MAGELLGQSKPSSTQRRTVPQRIVIAVAITAGVGSIVLIVPQVVGPVVGVLTGIECGDVSSAASALCRHLTEPAKMSLEHRIYAYLTLLAGVFMASRLGKRLGERAARREVERYRREHPEEPCW